METRATLRTRGIVAGLAALGVVGAHGIAYLVATPEPDAREHVLETTGHEYWALAIAAALGLFMAGTARLFTGGAADARHAVHHMASVRFRRTALRLALLQLVGFVLLEASERVLTSGSAAGLMEEPAFRLGLVLQVVAAILSALLVTVFARVVRHLLARTGLSFRKVRATSWDLTLDALPPRFEVATGAGTLRGPPLRSSSR